ncbi:polysialyltransferase family glycosyltransferase [Phormidesmis sp. 146-12]
MSAIHSSQPFNRIITCQGSIQLVTALSVMRHRERTQPEAKNYANYLVIYDLFAPAGQNEQFVAFVKQMAMSVCEWAVIVYLTPDTLQSISQRLEYTSPQTIFDQVHQLVGIKTADEIHLCRNWQFGNQLLLNAYQTAEKVCYGDSVGLYFSATSPIVRTAALPKQPSAPLSAATQFRRFWRRQAGQALQQIRQQLNLRTVLQTIPFDIGYFVLPDILGEVPPMPTVTIERTFLLEVFAQLANLADAEYVRQFQVKTAGATIAFLLTSNLSEAQRLSQAQEIAGYRQFLQSQGNQSRILVIKPHPRDDINKLYALRSTLTDLFDEIVILAEPELFFLPFEVFFLAACSQINLLTDVQVFAVSSACLSLKLLFDVPSFVGFGPDLTRSLFRPEAAQARIEHEQALRTALQKLTFDSPRVTAIP